MMEIQRIAVKSLALNEGQVEGLPRNPRTWTRDELDRLARSIEETPELFEARPVLAYEWKDGEPFIVLGGNMRLTAAKQLGWKDVPCIVYPRGTERDKLSEIVIKDNGAFGSWDWDALANEWDSLPLNEWGVSVWKMPEETDSDTEEILAQRGKYGEADERTERWMDEAMVENALETTRQIDYMIREGWLPCGYTLGMAKRMFLRAKFYGAILPQWFSYYFIPERIFCPSGSRKSMYSQLCSTRIDSGCSGLRTIQETGRAQEAPLLLLLQQKGRYPIGGGRLPLDFPSSLAADLILEFVGKKASILDPCHGWGGRLAGALLADVSYYEGYDPSPYAHRGVQNMADAFTPYVEGARVCLCDSPYEDADVKNEFFDLALTSPPYYDVELYEGAEQAHNRYDSFDKWVEGFYTPLIHKTYEALKDGGLFILQVGSQKYPLKDVGIEIAERAGFTCLEIRPFGHGTSSALHGNTDECEENEKIIILGKGSCYMKKENCEMNKE